MKHFFISVIIFFSLNSVNAQNILMSCLNPQTGQVSLQKRGINSKGIGMASSPKFQFNIQIESKGGAIFVNERNDGVCTVTISPGYRLLRGVGRIDPVDISNEYLNRRIPEQTPPSLATTVSTHCVPQEVDTLKCNVHMFSNELKGTINVNWNVEYEQAN